MTMDELAEWCEFIGWEAEEKKKAMDRAKRDAGAKSPQRPTRRR